MKYNRCGKSGLMLPAISLGGWNHFDTVDKTRELVLGAFGAGVTYFDMANNYGPPPGAAETHLGYLLSGDLVCHRDEIVISTKAGHDMWAGPYGSWGSRKHVLASLDHSLRRLRVNYVDIFYSHRFDPGTPLEETMGALHTAVVSGKALYAAISNYPADASKEAAKIMDHLGTPLVAHQCSYSMLNRAPEDEVIERAEKRGMGFLAFSPLAQGLLSSRYLGGGVPEGSRASLGVTLTADRITPELVKKLNALAALAADRGQTLNRLAIQWCLRDARVASVIVGARDAGQLQDNLQALDDAPLDDATLFAVDKILGVAPKPATEHRKEAAAPAPAPAPEAPAVEIASAPAPEPVAEPAKKKAAPAPKPVAAAKAQPASKPVAKSAAPKSAKKSKA